MKSKEGAQIIKEVSRFRGGFMNKLSGLQLLAANFRGSNSGDSVKIAICLFPLNK